VPKLFQQRMHSVNYPALLRSQKRAQHADHPQIPLTRTPPTSPLVD